MAAAPISMPSASAISATIERSSVSSRDRLGDRRARRRRDLEHRLEELVLDLPAPGLGNLRQHGLDPLGEVERVAVERASAPLRCRSCTEDRRTCARSRLALPWWWWSGAARAAGDRAARAIVLRVIGRNCAPGDRAGRRRGRTGGRWGSARDEVAAGTTTGGGRRRRDPRAGRLLLLGRRRRPERGRPRGRQPRGEPQASVVRVVDGDTILVALDGAAENVRYIGVDTPETPKAGPAGQCLAEQATELNRRLVGGRGGRAALRPELRDRYGQAARLRNGPIPVRQRRARPARAAARTLAIEPNTERAARFARLAGERQPGGSGSLGRMRA